MNTYYIVKHTSPDDTVMWKAHRKGILSAFDIYNHNNVMWDSYSAVNADECEIKLRRSLNPVKPEVVRVVKI